jgi:hypothetical protein
VPWPRHRKTGCTRRWTSHDRRGALRGPGRGGVGVAPLALHQEAAAICPRLPWTVIGIVESDNGQSTLPGVHSRANAAVAEGPMQFQPPTFPPRHMSRSLRLRILACPRGATSGSSPRWPGRCLWSIGKYQIRPASRVVTSWTSHGSAVAIVEGAERLRSTRSVTPVRVCAGAQEVVAGGDVSGGKSPTSSPAWAVSAATC